MQRGQKLYFKTKLRFLWANIEDFKTYLELRTNAIILMSLRGGIITILKLCFGVVFLMIIKVFVIFIIKRRKSRRFFMKRRCNKTTTRRLRQKHESSSIGFKLKRRKNGD